MTATWVHCTLQAQDIASSAAQQRPLTAEEKRRRGNDHLVESFLVSSSAGRLIAYQYQCHEVKGNMFMQHVWVSL